MRDFNSILGIDLIDRFDGWRDFTMSGVIAFQFVRVEPTRFTTLTFDQAAEKALGGFLVPLWLHQNINGVPILIDRAPEILMLSLDRDNRFIEMPGIAQPTLAFLESARIRWTKFQAPAPYRFIGDDDTPLSEQLFHFRKAETKSMIEPDGVTDDGRRESVTLLADLFGCHAKQSAKNELM